MGREIRDRENKFPRVKRLCNFKEFLSLALEARRDLVAMDQKQLEVIQRGSNIISIWRDKWGLHPCENRDTWSRPHHSLPAEVCRWFGPIGTLGRAEARYTSY